MNFRLPRLLFTKTFILIALGGGFSSLLLGVSGRQPDHATSPASSCEQPGWFPTDFGLKDHAIFAYGGQTYIVSNYIPSEKKFAYARSSDLCNWEELSFILSTRTPGAWDELAVWAPFVYQENGTYYMYYTGVATNITQSILLATSTNPADPASWTKQPMVFQPDHPGMVWQNGSWADCRDPTVIKAGSTYYLIYTGQDVDGHIIGVATAASPAGPWTDLGALSPYRSAASLESATMVAFEGNYYLFYNDTSLNSEMLQVGTSPTGPWGTPRPFQPGWAHEVWKTSQGEWFTSFLTDYTVSISPITWDLLPTPPYPFMGNTIWRTFFPLTSR